VRHDHRTGLIRTWFSDAADVEARPGAVGSLTFGQTSDAPNIVGINGRRRRSSAPFLVPLGIFRRRARRRKPTRRLVTFTLVADGDERTRLRRRRIRPRQMDMADDEKQSSSKTTATVGKVQGDRLRDLFCLGHASSP